MEAEIRRLEELNKIDAQRMREPITTDESPEQQKDNQISFQNEVEMMRLQEEETKANCLDEYNLLSNTANSQE